MYEGDLQTVLRCPQCNKPFDKESTLKRHGYHCRSRRAGITNRSRSCISCAKGKARCDNRRPGCSRCTVKAIECHYPTNKLKDTVPRIQHNDNAPTERRKRVPLLTADSNSIQNRLEGSADGDVILDSALAISDPQLTSFGGEILDWNNPDIDFSDIWNSQINDEVTRYPSSGVSSSTPYLDPLMYRTIQAEPAIFSPRMSIPIGPTTNVRSFVQRPKAMPRTQRIGSLILHTLKSYPSMMMFHNTLPPFIHPHSISSDDTENDHMEPLNNCISLLHMISSGIKGSRKLFWKNVRLECERMREEHLKYDKWELLAALQALSIYIFIRMDEGETDHNNLDFTIVATVILISKQLNSIEADFITPSAIRDNRLEISWKDWIFEESRRRLCVVYRVVDMLVFFEPAAMCDLHTDLIIAPLPAKKQLWEAGNELLWKIESEREPGTQTDFGLAADGELVKLDEKQLRCSDSALLHKPSDASVLPRNTANWNEWCSGMDGFGGLVMLAASLIG